MDNEKIWLHLTNLKRDEYKVTTIDAFDRRLYFLYKNVEKEWIKISENSDPSVFDKIVFLE